jgi:glyoxylase-like metal-dependent hydrolase (beta-lactamase superfamily II)
VLAAERNYSIRQVIDTHIHADHLSGNRRLAHLAGAEQIGAEQETDCYWGLEGGGNVPSTASLRHDSPRGGTSRLIQTANVRTGRFPRECLLPRQQGVIDLDGARADHDGAVHASRRSADIGKAAAVV